MKGLVEFAKEHPIITFLIVDTICVTIKQVVSDIKLGDAIKVTPIEES